MVNISKNIRYILSATVISTLILCFMPTKASEIPTSDIVNNFNSSVTTHAEEITANNNTNGFTATEPQPIENVEDLSPEGTYPSEIENEDLLRFIFPRSSTYTIIDIETGKSFNAVRYGGNKHLDTEPKTKKDADILKSIAKSWDRRAVILCYKGGYYAASINTMPHGNGYVSSNGFDGHFCLHVRESKTHGGNKVCELHQGMIDKAMATEITQMVSDLPSDEKVY